GSQSSNPLDFTVLPPSIQVPPSPSGSAIALPFRPRDVALASSGALVYAVGEGGLAVVNLDPQRPNPRVPVPLAMGAASHLALTADGTHALVTLPDSGIVAAVDVDLYGATFGAIEPIDVNGTPFGVAIDPSRRRAFATDQKVGRIYEIDLDPNS